MISKRVGYISVTDKNLKQVLHQPIYMTYHKKYKLNLLFSVYTFYNDNSLLKLLSKFLNKHLKDFNIDARKTDYYFSKIRINGVSNFDNPRIRKQLKDIKSGDLNGFHIEMKFPDIHKTIDQMMVELL